MITSDQIRNSEVTVDSVVTNAQTIATTLAPEYAGLIILGGAVAKGAPELFADAIDLANKKEPTAADDTAFLNKVQALRNPATL